MCAKPRWDIVPVIFYVLILVPISNSQPPTWLGPGPLMWPKSSKGLLNRNSVASWMNLSAFRGPHDTIFSPNHRHTYHFQEEAGLNTCSGVNDGHTGEGLNVVQLPEENPFIIDPLNLCENRPQYKTPHVQG